MKAAFLAYSHMLLRHQPEERVETTDRLTPQRSLTQTYILHCFPFYRVSENEGMIWRNRRLTFYFQRMFW